MRIAKIAAAAVAASLTALPAAAQDYPSRNVTLIIPYAAGGPTDGLARVLGPGLTAKLGQTFVIENIGGGGSTIGTGRVARAAPDGHTLLLHNQAIAMNVSLYPNMTFHPEKNLTPVGLLNTSSIVVVGRKDLPANNLAELKTWMKANRTKFAHPGAGNTGHLCAVLFTQALGVQVDYIPYRGGGPALQDVIGGHVDMFCSSTQAAMEPVKAGLVKAYGITTPEPHETLPQVPSLVKELGPKLDIPFWQGLFAPAGTPKAIIDKLNAAAKEVVSDAKVASVWRATGISIYPPDQQTTAAAQAVLSNEIKRWADVIRENKIEVPQQ